MQSITTPNFRNEVVQVKIFSVISDNWRVI
jgi:hypothetical protein